MHIAFSRLHPSVNLLFFLFAMGFGMLIQHPLYMVINTLCAAALCLNLRGSKGRSTIFSLLPLWIALTVINPLINPQGDTVLFTYFDRPFTLESMYYGAILGGMFVSMLLWFSCWNVIMTDDKFTYLFSNLAPSLALLLTMIFRLIPSFQRKLQQTLDARKCIGMGGVEDASFTAKVQDGMTALSALASWALEGSVVTADSMNSRGYGCSKRSCFHQYRFTPQDKRLLGLYLLLLSLVFITLARGGGSVSFIPAIQLAPVSGWNLLGLVAYLSFLLSPMILNMKEDLLWHISKSKI